MELFLLRKTLTNKSTVGTLAIGVAHESYVLEDVDRALNNTMPADYIRKIKVYGKTAIPTGRYQVVLTYSNRFKQYMPLLLNVPGFDGIRIHWGNTAIDTEGCLLVGNTVAKDFVGESKKAYSSLFIKLQAAEKKEKIFITIT